MPLRACSTPALATALANGSIREFNGLSIAELFTFTLADNATVHRWTSWNSSLPVGANTFEARGQKLKRTKLNVTNTMQVPELTVRLLSLNDDFNGGGSIKRQIRNGLFTGAMFLMQDLYMPTPGDTITLGTMDMFGGVVAGITIEGAVCQITIRGKNNLLDQYAPRAIYQPGCYHGFCDAGCTLDVADFTLPYTVGSSPTAIFLPWASAPGDPSLYVQGQILMTSGAAMGQSRDVVDADGTGLTLEVPLYDMPLAGDTFDAVEGCDYTKASGNGRSCADRANEQNYFGFPFIPPPTTQY
jgi:uncharacterized phage protein (TIGR02218 family)